IGAEETFSTDLFLEKELEQQLVEIAETVWERYKRSNVKAKTLTLKFKYADFEQHTRSRTISGWFTIWDQFMGESFSLLHAEQFIKGIRLLGLTLSNFQTEERNEPVQLMIEF